MIFHRYPKTLKNWKFTNDLVIDHFTDLLPILLSLISETEKVMSFHVNVSSDK
jgi:hypothetical protein